MGVRGEGRQEKDDEKEKKENMKDDVQEEQEKDDMKEEQEWMMWSRSRSSMRLWGE